MWFREAFVIEFASPKERRLFWFTLLIVLSSWGYMYSGIFSVIHLGHDEAGQIWISKGLNHHSPTFAPEGGLREIYQNNNTHNLDPGLFSYLLHFWMKLGGDGYLWLKSLPLLFFGIFLFFFYHLMRWVLEDPISPLLVLGLYPFSNVLLTISINIRPYSLEYAVAYGLIFFIYLKHRKRESLSLYQIWILGIVSAIFLWTRYSFSVNIAFVGIYILILDGNDLKARLRNGFIYVLPVLVSVGLIYWFVLRYQNSGLLAPSFYQDMLIKYTGWWPYIKMNLFSMRSAPFTIFLGLLIAGLLGFSKTFLQRKSVFLLGLILTIQVVYMAYSLLGLSPWSIRNPRSAHLILFSLFGAATLVHLFRKWTQKSLILKFGHLMFLISTVLICWNKLDYRHSFLYQLINEVNFSKVLEMEYSSLTPEYKYFCTRTKKIKFLPDYNGYKLLDEGSVLLEDGRAPVMRDKIILNCPRPNVRKPVLYEVFSVNLIQIKQAD